MALEVPCPACKAPLHVREEYVGKQLRCPRCAAVLTVPAGPTPAAEPRELVRPVARVVPPPVPADPPAAGAVVDPNDVAEVLPAPTRRCPRCGETIAARANRCRYCRAWLDEDDDEEEEEYQVRRRRASYKPCPRCGAGGPERVTWTPWGSFYGPALFTHVRCRECGYGYNGRTGRSNMVPAVIMVTVPAVLIVAIIVGLLFVLGVFGGRRW
jgi:hypothetical protein